MTSQTSRRHVQVCHRRRLLAVFGWTDSVFAIHFRVWCPVRFRRRGDNLVAESSPFDRSVSSLERSGAALVVVVVVAVVVATSPLHEGDGDRGRALEGAGYRVCASPSSASQTLTVLNLRPPEPPNTSRLSRSDVPRPHSQRFKSFAASAEHGRWRLSRLENGLRIFEEDESQAIDSASPHPTSISTPASKVRRPPRRVSSTAAHTAPPWSGESASRLSPARRNVSRRSPTRL